MEFWTSNRYAEHWSVRPHWRLFAFSDMPKLHQLEDVRRFAAHVMVHDDIGGDHVRRRNFESLSSGSIDLERDHLVARWVPSPVGGMDTRSIVVERIHFLMDRTGALHHICLTKSNKGADAGTSGLR